MKKVEAIIRPDKLAEVLLALEEKGFYGSTVGDVRGHGQQPSGKGSYRGDKFELHVIHKMQLAIVCEDAEVAAVVEIICEAARTGSIGDGIVMVSDIAVVFQIRSGARDAAAV